MKSIFCWKVNLMYLKYELIFWSVRIPFSVLSFISKLANSVTSKEEKIT